MDKHTPGPWGCKDTSYGSHDYMLTKPDGSRLPVNAPSNDHGEQRANARLISAAPELLEACRILLRESAGRKLDVRKDYHLMVALEAAKTAIAKATRGGQVMRKATPGPWAVLAEESPTPFTGLVTVIARVDKDDPGYAHRIGHWVYYENDGVCPNSVLISQAPALLQVLKKVVAQYGGMMGGSKIMDEAVLVINAAEGA